MVSVKKKGEVERKNGRRKEQKKKIEREKCLVGFGKEERMSVKKKEKRKKEREKINLIKEERQTN